MNSIDILEMSIKGKDEIERALLLMLLGIYEAMGEEVLTPDKAEDLLFNPYSHGKLKELGVRTEILDLIHGGWEMEALKILDEKAFFKTVNEEVKLIKSLLSEYSAHGESHDDKWFT